MLIGMGLACSPKIYGAVKAFKAFKGISKADRKLVKSALERRWERGDIYQPSIEGRGAVIILQPTADAA
jgi:hypothetical protein